MARFTLLTDVNPKYFLWGIRKNILTSRHGNKRPFWQYAIGTLETNALFGSKRSFWQYAIGMLETYFNVLTFFEDSERIDPL